MSNENPYRHIVFEMMKRAGFEAKVAKAAFIHPLHLFIAACKQEHPPAVRAFERLRIDGLRLRRRVRGFARVVSENQDPPGKELSPEGLAIVRGAGTLAAESGHPCGPSHFLMALLDNPGEHLQIVFHEEELSKEELWKALFQEEETADWEALAREHRQGIAEDKNREEERGMGGGSVLSQFGRDYTALAREGKLEPMIGRRNELKQIVRILLRKQKCNPVLLGEPGVGKTALVEGLASFAAGEGAPPEVKDLRVVEVSLSSLVAGAKYRGDFEERLEALVAEAESDPNLVVFFDEIHTIVGAGGGSGAMDASNILKPALARGGFRCIGATTLAEYRQYFEKDGALERRFQPVRIEEPTPSETKEILEALRPGYETHHQITIDASAIQAAVDLSVRYLPDRRLPDKARDLLDQAAAAKRFRTLGPMSAASPAELSVNGADVATVLAEWTGIPVERLTATSKERFASMEETLRRRVVGQDHALSVVSNAVRTAMTGLGNPHRPHGVLLFTGPSGVGKTELAKALADFLFDDEARLIRLDMSEYMEEQSVAKLIGSPPGYVGHEEGGRLTDSVRANPYSIVLLDEVEKAHPRVFDLFLQVFDDGRLSDSRGRTADFTNTFIILTSNLTAQPQPRDETPKVGFDRSQEEASPSPRASEDQLRALLMNHFRPELINRIGHIVEFHPLGERELKDIIDKLLVRITERLEESGITLRMAPGGYEMMMAKGFQPHFGARGLERVLEQNVVQPLAQGILDGRYAHGDVVEVDGGKGGVVLRILPHEDSFGTGSILMTRMLPSKGTDASLLLLDLVGSTRMLVEGGDTHFVASIHDLRNALGNHELSHRMTFLKGTGDGFLAVFDDMESVVKVAMDLRDSLPAVPGIRAVGHAGRVRVGPDGDPLGEEVHRLFRIEAAREDSRVQDSVAGSLIPMPETGGILLSTAGFEALPAELSPAFEPLGTFHLKGFEEPERLWVNLGRPPGIRLA